MAREKSYALRKQREAQWREEDSVLERQGKQRTKENERIGLIEAPRLRFVSRKEWEKNADVRNLKRDDKARKARERRIAKVNKYLAYKNSRPKLDGQTFGKLLVIERSMRRDKDGYLTGNRYKCRCACGNITIVRCGDLLRGKTRSCGCLRTDLYLMNSPVEQRVKIGLDTLTVRQWAHLRKLNLSTIRDRMRSGESPESALTRPMYETFEVDGEYRQLKYWLYHFGMSRTTVNRRLNDGCSLKEALTTPVPLPLSRTPILINGETKTFNEWKEHFGISDHGVRYRLSCGEPIESALSRPTDNLIYIEGEARSLKEWAKHFGIGHRTVYQRMEKGETVESALRRPSERKSLNHKVTINGVTKTFSEWLEANGLHADLVRRRMWEGESLEAALVRPKGAARL